MSLTHLACSSERVKLVVVYIRLQQFSYCYRWIHAVLVTKRIHNKALRH